MTSLRSGFVNTNRETRSSGRLQLLSGETARFLERAGTKKSREFDPRPLYNKGDTRATNANTRYHLTRSKASEFLGLAKGKEVGQWPVRFGAVVLYAGSE